MQPISQLSIFEIYQVSDIRKESMIQFLIAVFIVSLVKGFDVYISYLFTPDFSLTINPFRSLLPVYGFLVYQFLLLIIFVIGIYWYYFKKPDIEKDGLSFGKYLGLLFYKNENIGKQWLTKSIKSYSPIVRLLGFWGIYLIIPISIICIISNILCKSNTEYLDFYLSIGRTIINSISILLALVFIFVFLRSEYAKYEKRIKLLKH
jgi:hypothetical protein